MNLFLFIIIMIGAEVLFTYIFSFIANFFYQKNGFNTNSIIKGLIERFFLFFALINNYPHALTLFGALKIATRLKHDTENKQEEDSYNSFYLIGNFLSVMLAIVYVLIYKYIFCLHFP